MSSNLKQRGLESGKGGGCLHSELLVVGVGEDLIDLRVRDSVPDLVELDDVVEPGYLLKKAIVVLL